MYGTALAVALAQRRRPARRRAIAALPPPGSLVPERHGGLNGRRLDGRAEAGDDADHGRHGQGEHHVEPGERRRDVHEPSRR